MTREVVYRIFTDLLSLEDPIDWTAVKYQETAGWDSVAHMAIVAEIEEEFGIMLDTDDIIDMSSVDRTLELLEKYEIDAG